MREISKIRNSFRPPPPTTPSYADQRQVAIQDDGSTVPL